jgi:hypothetical protein
MSQTEGRWTGKTSFPDLQLFYGADQFLDVSTLSTVAATIGTAGVLFKTVGVGAAAIFVSSLPGLLLRSGVYATPQYDQEQYGTKASVPGPTAVANTSEPLALPNPATPYFQGFPPTPGSSMATLAGAASGPQPKGIQIDSVTPIYQVLADATAVAATIGLTKSVFANGAEPAVTNLIALGANGLPTAIAAHPVATVVAVGSPAMIVAANTEMLLNINLTGGTAGTIKFFGAVIKAHYNFA